MARNETLEQRLERLIDTRFVILTKGGTINAGEKAWIEHTEKELMQYGVVFPNGLESLRPVYVCKDGSSAVTIRVA
jgi:hypothetical protein